jgi:hypothetical protein
VDTTQSVDGVPIRLTEERWFHIVENHDEVAGYYDEVLDTVASPEVVVQVTVPPSLQCAATDSGAFYA